MGISRLLATLHAVQRWILHSRFGLAGVASRLLAATMTLAGVVLMAVSFAAPGAAFANAANPAPTTVATPTVNADGSVTIALSGTWTWPGQDCKGRYAEGWAVDWWGISTSQTPTNNFTMTSTTQLTSPPNGVTTASQAVAGALPIENAQKKPTGQFFHVGANYNGTDINGAGTCTDVGAGNAAGSQGDWTATGTYPSAADVPPQLCVIMYDEHGGEGNPSNSATDYSATNNDDNSIHTNAFDPTMGAGYCFSSNFTPQVSVAKSGPATGNAGGTGTYSLVVSNAGSVAASNVVVTDKLPVGETYVSSVDSDTASGTCTGSSASQTVTCGVDSVPANSKVNAISVTVSYANNASGTLTDCATVPGQATPSCVPTLIQQQTLAGNIFLCNNGTQTTNEVAGGTLAADGAGLTPIAAQPNPLAATQVLAGTYTMTATAPNNYVFTACGANGVTISTPTTATQSITVPTNGNEVGVFYVTPKTAPSQTIEGHIYDCVAGAPSTTEQPGGSLSADGPQSVPSHGNPLGPEGVVAGTYTMTANAPAGFEFTACTGSATIGNPPSTATESVVVPSGQSGVGIFYVVQSVIPTQTIEGHIYQCTNGSTKTTTEVTGGSLSATGPQTVPQTGNPLGPDSVLAGTYTMSANAPAGFAFTDCTGGATTGSTATQSVVVPSGSKGVGTFYVSPVTPPTQTIVGHIFQCNGTTATMTEVPGGTLSATGPQTVPSASNPLGPDPVLAGTYTMTANAPNGFVFTACNGGATTGTTATQSVVVPSGGQGVGTFYVTPVTQTIIGHIYLCDGTTETTTEVPGGSIATTSGPQLISATPNPLSQQVPAGTYTETATAPTGFFFTDCSSSSTGTPTTATQTVVVPSGGTGTGTFFVSPNTPGVTVSVSKTNDANGSGTFSQTETATGPGETVPFRVVVTNIGTVPVDITSLSDIWPGHSLVSGLCSSSVIGQTLQPGDTATCDFTISDYAPAAGNSLTDTATATGCQPGSTTNCQTVPATSTVITPAATSPGTTPPATSPPATTPSAPVATNTGLAFTGVPARLQLLLELGFGLLSAGMFILFFTRPRRVEA